MQSSQRTEYNHSLEYAINKANHHQKPLLVLFVITENFPEANARHYYFMLEGLKEVQNNLSKRNIKMIIRKGSMVKEVRKMAEQSLLTVCDKGYLKIERAWRKSLASGIKCPLVEIESNLIIPVEKASPKEEYAAYTFRKKVKKVLKDFLTPFKYNNPDISSLAFDLDSISIDNINSLVKSLEINQQISKVKKYHGGSSKAQQLLDLFLEERLEKYQELSNDPTKNYLSGLSPYLHFGQISPLDIALKILEKKDYKIDDLFEESPFLEELIIRRELSFNFIYYNQEYNKTLKDILPEWAYQSLEKHKNDHREYLYTREEFEDCLTHDDYWNAANKELKTTGKIHSYMRMYWGKKILEWSKSPEDAFQIALYLNNKYALDGRDANSFAGIAWCFGKHDRAWKERKIYGKIRYMNANGLERKFEMEKYITKINNIENNSDKDD